MADYNKYCYICMDRYICSLINTFKRYHSRSTNFNFTIIMSAV